MAKILWYAFRYPRSLILVTAPKFDQAKNIAFKALAVTAAEQAKPPPSKPTARTI
jgi:hypothetical protein